MLSEYIQKYKNITDYLPIILITVFFVAEAELEKHALHTSCQIAITIITLAIFYILSIRFKSTKFISLLVCIIIWIFLIYIKKTYIK